MEKESCQRIGHLSSDLRVWRSHCSYRTRGKGEEKQGCSVDGGHDEVVEEAEEKMCRLLGLVKVVLTCGALELEAREKQS